MNSKCRITSALVASYLLLSANYAMAKTLYQEHVEKAEISKKVLQQSLKQVKEHKEITILNEISVPPFHKRMMPKTTTKKPFCMTCHLPLPHQKNERSRTFMNMHSRYIACETCHFVPKKTNLDYRWLSYDSIKAGNEIAPPRISETTTDISMKTERKHKAQFKKRTPLAPQPGSRISPFYKNVPALLFKDHPFSQKIATEWKDADENRRAEIKAKIHIPLKKQGIECQKCHGRKKPILNLKKLGATPAQRKAIQNNIIVRFFDRFKKEEERIRIDKLLQ